jgi:hypothetical protein
LFRSTLPSDLRVTYAVGVLVPFVFGGVLWLFPARLANTMVHPGVAPGDSGPEWAVRLERIGMSLLGVYLLFQALSGLASHVTLYRAVRGVELDAARDFYPALIGRLVQAAFALLLVLRSDGIVNALARLRVAGTRRRPAGAP